MNAQSAVASVKAPGVLPTQIPRAVAAGTSTLLNPTAKLLTTFSRGPASSSSPSMRSVKSDTRPSQSAIFRLIRSYGGGNCSGQTSASQAARMRLSPASGMRRVTKIFGLDIKVFGLR